MHKSPSRIKEERAYASAFMPKKSVGTRAELLVCCDLLVKGYEVFRNVSPHGTCDLVALKSDNIFRIEVKSGNVRSSGRISHAPAYYKGHFEVLAVVLPDGKILYNSLDKDFAV